MKDDLWDVLITLPPAHTTHAQEKIWPTVESPKGVPVKATQRDLRRFRTLKSGLRRINAAATSAVVDDTDNDTTTTSEPTGTNGTRPNPRRQSRLSTASLTTTTSAFLPPSGADAHLLADAAEQIVEPMTWAALAYSGFMFWASAGEQRRSDEAEEVAHDNGLLADLVPYAPSPAPPPSQQSRRRPSGSFNVTGTTAGSAGMSDSLASLTARRVGTGMDGFLAAGDGANGGAAEQEEDRARAELGIITYFHRLTANVLGTLAEVVAATEEDEYETEADISRTQSEDGGEGERLIHGERRSESEEEGDIPRAAVRVDSEALAAMGLDVWSQADAAFVREIVGRYFARRARVEGKGVEVCGLRVC